MSDIIEKIEYKGYTIQIIQDMDPECPRNWDNLGKMICFHSRYDLGDNHNFSDSQELIDYLKENKTVNLPLYLYDHSGITINTTGFSCPWDSGQIGIIYVDYETIKKEYNWKTITAKRKQKIIEYLKSEVKCYDQYLTGDVYGYCIEKDQNHLDSCYGFYGYENIKELVKECKGIIDYDIRKRIKKHIEKVKQWIINKVPLHYRKPLKI